MPGSVTRSHRLRLRAVGAALLVVVPLLGGFGAGPPMARALDVSFDPPSADSEIGVSLGFRTTFRAASPPARVELLTRLPTDEATFVQQAQVVPDGEGYRAEVVISGHTTPNTTVLYRFRAVGEDGTVAEGPEARHTVTDDQVTWRTLEGRIVRLHWYEGDEAFARRALEIGDAAVDEVSGLLGVTETEPVDFFIYATEDALRLALGPGTRENVGGQSNAAIRTLFGLIEPSEIDSDWVEVLVRHELMHLVFETAVKNPYNRPPRWLNEGLAVYQSEGYKATDRVAVEAAARTGQLIPLDGLGGLFPTTRDQFFLAYAESVSAVDFFIRTHGEGKLIELIRSYADGVTDDEAFTTATGGDLSAFNAAWIGDLGAEVPAAVGPQPGVPGPLPPGWSSSSAQPSTAPTPDRPSVPSGTITAVSGASASAGPEPGTLEPAPGGEEDLSLPIFVVGTLVAVGGALVVLFVMGDRRASRRP